MVLEAGGAGHSGGWELIQHDVAEFTRVCAYDRAGTGRSSSESAHATTQAIATDLHALLAEAGLAPPYVLAGHSLGGIIVRRFATQYPDGVAGMVLVDTSHGDQRARFQSAVTAEEWRLYGSANAETDFLFPEGVDLRGPDLADIPLVVLSAGQVREGVPADVAERLNGQFPCGCQVDRACDRNHSSRSGRCRRRSRVRFPSARAPSQRTPQVHAPG